jgi:hypothetical protein
VNSSLPFIKILSFVIIVFSPSPLNDELTAGTGLVSSSDTKLSQVTTEVTQVGK